ncbi:ion transporter [Actinomadura rubrisoli]|uniref:ion transporter n=1 Tax=Actinomadura rubrisoli TaxID=2530368 RepID=UPI001FB73DD1
MIVANAVCLGLDTVPEIVQRYGTILVVLDRGVLVIFVVELVLRVFAYGRAFWRDPWSVFDFLVVAMALIPSTGGLSVLRALRILRVLRLVSALPSLRRVVGALLAAMPGMGSIAGLLALVQYVAAVMATKLFGHIMPEKFGSLGWSLFTLFQIMTGDGWSDIVLTVMRTQPLAWIFFVVYIMVSTFAVLNLFMAVVVASMESQISDEIGKDPEGAQREEERDTETLQAVQRLTDEVSALHTELAVLSRVVTGGRDRTGPPP